MLTVFISILSFGTHLELYLPGGEVRWILPEELGLSSLYYRPFQLQAFDGGPGVDILQRLPNLAEFLIG